MNLSISAVLVQPAMVECVDPGSFQQDPAKDMVSDPVQAARWAQSGQ